jgi:hypothetical protein
MPWNDDEKTEVAHTFEISEEALNLYRLMRLLRCACEPPPPGAPFPDECDGCLEWALLNRELARLVRLPLHEICVVPPPNGEGGFLPEEENARRDAFEAALAERWGKT